ncbi:hypothetical protein Y032_0012g1645 [Ancylostoma ceylanicum]|uniref:Uncharacterized protein n=1 Tax=Ancylostoma ceylanicum TaxID=53326 RepID=A0A016VC82_9BILA|nr:hypothetical protein Y032_0012g1645 [Ancylostoma ceylanicum]
MTSSRVAVNSFGDTVSLCRSPDVDGDVVVEWRDSGREVAIELTKYPDLMSRYTQVAQGFQNCFCFNGVKGFLQIDERETEKHLVLSRYFNEPGDGVYMVDRTESFPKPCLLTWLSFV